MRQKKQNERRRFVFTNLYVCEGELTSSQPRKTFTGSSKSLNRQQLFRDDDDEEGAIDSSVEIVGERKNMSTATNRTNARGGEDLTSQARAGIRNAVQELPALDGQRIARALKAQARTTGGAERICKLLVTV